MITNKEKSQKEVVIEKGTNEDFEVNLKVDSYESLDEIDIEHLDDEWDYEEDELDYEDKEEEEEQQQEQNEEEEEMEEAEFVISDLIPSVSTVVSRIADPGILSVINSNNGKRVSFSSEIYDRLKQPTTLQVAYLESQMVIGQHLGDEHPTYVLKKQGAKQIIYNKELVDQITKHCGLDFTNRTSITFPTAIYKKMNGNIVVVIGME